MHMQNQLYIHQKNMYYCFLSLFIFHFRKVSTLDKFLSTGKPRKVNYHNTRTKLAFTWSKSAIEKPEQWVISVQI